MNVEELSVSYKEKGNNLQIQNADKGYAIISWMANKQLYMKKNKIKNSNNNAMSYKEHHCRPNLRTVRHPISLESKIDVIYISESQCNAMNKRHHTFIEKKSIYIDNVNSVMYMNSKSLQSKK